MSDSGVGLIGDIGATNARFALVVPPGSKPDAVRIYALDDYASLAQALEAYLTDVSPTAPPVQSVLAVASPVTSDQVALTNHPWTFSIEALREQFRLKRLLVVNDFAAAAAAIPQLGDDDCVQIGGGKPVDGAPAGVIGPGTGLGVSAFLLSADEPIMLSGEGGHVTMSPATARESAILDLMRARFDHVSAERVLSGPGLINLYNAVCELDHALAASYFAEQITSPAVWQKDAHAREATSIFCSMLGTVAGNLALTLGARGGIYIAGGIVPRIADFFAESEFRARFEAKGRMRGYLESIPTYVIVRPLLGLLGAAALLGRCR